MSGEPGIGKTALLAVARERAVGMQVLAAVGVEAEADLPFAALAELASPLIDDLASLPSRQASAVEAALAIGDSSGPFHDPLAVCVGFLGLLRAAAARNPLLVVVDDAHWLDSSSAGCIGYAARRLDGAKVALLAAARPVAGVMPLDGHLRDELRLAALGREDALALLRRTAGDIAPSTAEALLAAAAGNPLALIELPSLLSDEQRRGAARFDPAPAQGGSLWQAFERQVTAQGSEVTAAMLVAAASIDREIAPVLAACDELGIPRSALERGEEAGLVELRPERIVFAHPLLRAVVDRGASAVDRRGANAALARHARPDAAAWHLAAASVGPDAEAADALEAAADRAVTRGAYGTAADALERSATLTEDAEQRTMRMFAAGLAAAIGGGYERGAALLEPISDAPDPATRASVRHLLASVRLVGGFGSALGNHDMLCEEADRIREMDPTRASMMYADAGVCATVAADCPRALAAGLKATEVLPDEAPAAARAQAFSMLGMGLAITGQTAQARAALDEAGALLSGIDPLSPAAQSTAFALHARLSTGQEAALFREAREFAHSAAAAGSAGLLPYYEMLTADSAFRIGDWEAAQLEADAAVAIADHSGQCGPLTIALVIQGRIAGAQGRDQEARAALERAIRLAQPPGYGSSVLWGHAALGFVDLAHGRAREAIAQLEECGRLAGIAGLEDPTIVPWASDLVEAYVNAGRDEPAQRVCEQLTVRAGRAALPLPLALAERCRGLTSRGEFEPHFLRALELHDSCQAPLERARALLAFGSRLHRACRRVEARERLREALADFERLGAEPWAERARAELRASGAVRRPAAASDELTAQEARVAIGVARGLTNREVAEDLFLSPKTVEFHLGRVFRKLGIRSRTELAVLVAEGRVDSLGGELERDVGVG